MNLDAESISSELKLSLAKQLELRERYRQLEDKASSILFLTGQGQEIADHLNSIRNLIEGKAKELQKIQESVSEREKHLEEREEEYELKEEELAKIQELVGEGLNGMEEKRKELEGMKQMVEAGMTEIEVKEKKFEEECKQLKLKDKKVMERLAEIEQKEKEIQERCKGLEVNEKKFEEGCKEFVLRELKVEKQCEMLKLKENQIEERYREVELERKRIMENSKTFELKGEFEERGRSSYLEGTKSVNAQLMIEPKDSLPTPAIASTSAPPKVQTERRGCKRHRRPQNQQGKKRHQASPTLEVPREGNFRGTGYLYSAQFHMQQPADHWFMNQGAPYLNIAEYGHYDLHDCPSGNPHWNPYYIDSMCYYHKPMPSWRY